MNNEPKDNRTAELLISGEVARIIIVNSYALLRHKFRGTPLWSMVSQITGHGSGYSYIICDSAGLDGGQTCGPEKLNDKAAVPAEKAKA